MLELISSVSLYLPGNFKITYMALIFKFLLDTTILDRETLTSRKWVLFLPK